MVLTTETESNFGIIIIKEYNMLVEAAHCKERKKIPSCISKRHTQAKAQKHNITRRPIQYQHTTAY